jgi:hypothetical protein
MHTVGWKAVVAMSAALLLAGCAGTSAPAVKSATPTPTSSARFADEAAAVQAFRALYEKYIVASDSVFHDGGRNPERLKPYLSPKLYSEDEATFDDLRATGRRSVGDARLTQAKPQRVEPTAGGGTIYICLDQSKVRVLDKAGKDITPASRPPTQSLVVGFASEGQDLRIASSESWSGSSIC